jgi:hypothetical protein
MTDDLPLAILLGALLGVLHGAAAVAAPVVPNFTRGTITSDTSSRTEVVEVIRQVEYTTGTSYTVTGTNINIPLELLIQLQEQT